MKKIVTTVLMLSMITVVLPNQVKQQTSEKTVRVYQTVKGGDGSAIIPGMLITQACGAFMGAMFADNMLTGTLCGAGLATPLGLLFGAVADAETKTNKLYLELSKQGLSQYNLTSGHKSFPIPWSKFKYLHMRSVPVSTTSVTYHRAIKFGKTELMPARSTVHTNVRNQRQVGISFEGRTEPIWIREDVSSLSYEGFVNMIEHFLGKRLTGVGGNSSLLAVNNVQVNNVQQNNNLFLNVRSGTS